MRPVYEQFMGSVYDASVRGECMGGVTGKAGDASKHWVLVRCEQIEKDWGVEQGLAEARQCRS